MKSLENKLLIGIVAIAVLLLTGGIFFYHTLTDSIETAGEVAETHEILTEVEATLSTLENAETGQRGYLISGREDYLEPFYQANTEIDKRVERLKTLTANNPLHKARLAAADPLIRQEFDELRHTVKLRRNEGFESARDAVLTNEGKRKMDELRRLFGEIRDEETSALQTYLARSETAKRSAVTTFVVLFVLIVTLLLLIFFLIRYDAAARNLLEDRLRALARTDALTGLCNRGELNRQLEKETARARRYAVPLSMILLDIDFFKAVNDRYGHQIGDEVLKWIAKILRENARLTDTAARYGGEEFAVILPETNISQALIVAERIRAQIETSPYQPIGDTSTSIEIPLSASLGLAEWSPADTELNLVESADQALYQAKKEGRNRVIISSVGNI
jgi:diguanylate cyclase